MAYAPAGRETLEAITAEVVGGGSERHDSLPEIQVREAPAGRETLAAIAEELRPAIRPQLDTIPYADRIKNAPGAHTPEPDTRVAPRRARDRAGTQRGEPSGRRRGARRDSRRSTPAGELATVERRRAADERNESDPA